MPHPLKIKIQLFSGDEIAMGPGKADLLDAIKVHGSISAAGRHMAMSYRRAWLLVDAMNRCWDEPLVLTSPGRSKDSGARLTERGETVLAHYRSLQANVTAGAQSADLDALTNCLLDHPKASQKDLT